MAFKGVASTATFSIVKAVGTDRKKKVEIQLVISQKNRALNHLVVPLLCHFWVFVVVVVGSSTGNFHFIFLLYKKTSFFFCENNKRRKSVDGTIHLLC